MLFGLLVVVYVIVCIFLCLLILIQSDKGQGLSGTLGGGFQGASSLLGTQDTANILTRGTWIFGGVYAGICILMTILLSFTAKNSVDSKSLMKVRAQKQESYSPASILQNQVPMAQQGQEAGQGQSSQQPLTPAQSPIPLGDNKPAETPEK